MKVYVDELPKSCERCPFHDTKYGRCDISGSRVEYFGCHSLTPLSDHDKQVRKEVCERLDKIIEKYLCKKGRHRESLDISSIIKQVMKENLDQKQNKGENKK